MIAGSLEGAFAWKCSSDHEHEENEMCTFTGERPCGACKQGFHRDWEVCPQTVFWVRSEGCKYVVLPSSTPNETIAGLQAEYGYNSGGKKSNSIDLSFLERDRCEISRLSRCVGVLSKKFPSKKVEDEKEGNESRIFDVKDVWNSSHEDGYKSKEVLQRKRKLSERDRLEMIRRDYELLRRVELGESEETVKLQRVEKKE